MQEVRIDFKLLLIEYFFLSGLPYLSVRVSQEKKYVMVFRQDMHEY